MKLWEIEAEALLADGDDGLIPLVPLAHTNRPAAEIVGECVDRMNAVADETERVSLLTVANILLKLVGAPFDIVELPGGKAMWLEKIARQIDEAELAEALEKRKGVYVAEAKRSAVLAFLEGRFGMVPEEVVSALSIVLDDTRLQQLSRFAATCPDLAAFAAELSADLKPGT